MRTVLARAQVLAWALPTAGVVTQQLPLRHDPDRLTQGPMRIEKVKDGICARFTWAIS